MTEDPKNGSDPDDRSSTEETEDEEARAFILARRARFVAAALVGAGLLTAACGGESKEGTSQSCCRDPLQTGGMSGAGGASTGGSGGTGGAMPCLSVPNAGGYGGTGGQPRVCLSPPLTGGYMNSGGTGGAQVCLGVPLTGGETGSGGTTELDGGVDAAVNTGGVPLPCLTPVP